MVTLREALISIAGLWMLCCIQAQAHPHRHIDISAPSSSEQALKAAPAQNVVVVAGTPSPIHAFDIPRHPAPRLFVKCEYFRPVSRSEAQPELYRLFRTGLSPPSVFSTSV